MSMTLSLILTSALLPEFCCLQTYSLWSYLLSCLSGFYEETCNLKWKTNLRQKYFIRENFLLLNLQQQEIHFSCDTLLESSILQFLITCVSLFSLNHINHRTLFLCQRHSSDYTIITKTTSKGVRWKSMSNMSLKPNQSNEMEVLPLAFLLLLWPFRCLFVSFSY